MIQGKCMKRTNGILLFCFLLVVWMLAGSRTVAASSAPAVGENREGTEGETPAPEKKKLEIRFCGKDGSVYESLTVQKELGSTLVLPAVPSWEGKKNSGWKLEKDSPDVDGFVLMEGDSLLLSLKDSLADYIEDGKLYFYAVEPYRITFWNNSGSDSFSQMDIFPGEEIFLPDFPSGKYTNFGWTTAKGGSEVEYGIGQSYTVTSSADLYMVRYSISKVMTVSFCAASGATNAAFRALTTQILKGKKLVLPEVPVTTGYTNLGWSTKKNASKASYQPGDSLTVKKDLKLYAVRKKQPSCQVTFNNNAGTSTSNSYLSLGKKVFKGQYIVLPRVPVGKNSRGLGWTTVRKGKVAKYKAGDKVKVTKNLSFYAVTEKITYYTVEFYDSNGTQGAGFQAMKQTGAVDTDILLPPVPAKEGYVGMGWSTRKGSSVVSHPAGAKLTLKKNLSLYAVYKNSVTITLYKNDGTLYKTIQVAKGEYFTLPAVQSKIPYTMMGWSSSMGKATNPEYEVGESLRVISDRKFYAVVFNRNNEPDYEPAVLPSLITSRYQKVIFVGDSRIHRMSLTLSGAGIHSDRVSFVFKEGEGFAWFKSEGYAKLLQEIGSNEGRPTAVIFNLGINDLSNSENYITYFQSIAKELTARGCKLFYMSVNPINSANLKAAGRGERKEESVRTFNSMIRFGLCSGNGASYTYIDMYSYLIRNGYGTDGSATGTDSGVDDGLHYTEKTYKRIYKNCIDFLNTGRMN